MNKKILGIFVCMLLIGTTGIAVADWEEGDGHKMHFPQLPDPNGWDVDFHDWSLGDDWKCSESGPITDIHFWYSWAQDMEQDIEWIKVSIWSDDPGPPSKPAEQLWVRTFTMDEFVINGPWDGDQGWWHPTGEWIEHDHNMYWQINIVNIDEPWEQEEGVIYWLVIQMPYYSFPSPAVGWKTTQEHWNDNAVFGNPGNWISLWDPVNPDEPIDFAFVITGEEPKPDLVCEGNIVWTDIKPGDTVTGTFQVGNMGDPSSFLNWAVETTTLPPWGTNWTFSPPSGTGLPQGSWTAVTVSVEAPSEQNKNFTGKIKVVNTDDSSDYCKIDVSLSTPKNKAFNYNFPLLNWLFYRFPNAFPILKYFLVVSGFMDRFVKEGTGKLVMQLKDAPGLNITEALVNISQVRIHYAGEDQNDTNGTWINVSNETQTFDLIQLQNATEVLGEINLTAGWYTQIRLSVDKALVTIDGVQYDLKIPSKNVKLITPFLVQDNDTLILTLDFDVQKSVHIKGNGKYIMKPTIKVIQE